MKKILTNKNRTILFHILFWIVIWFFYVYFFSYNSTNKAYIFWFSSALLPITIGVTYLFIFLLIPRFLLKKSYWRFGLYSFYTLVGSAYFIVIVIYACLILILKFDVTNVPPMIKNFSFILILVYLVVGIVCFVTILNQNFKNLSRNKELENKILATQLQLKEQELHYLKRQIHPHFLFNTLNTIYGFALKQSKQTPDIILKLSNLLDYILYQVNKPLVSLKEEIMHIKEYIDLEKIRFQDTLKVEFYSDEIDNRLQIAPMLLIPFVENAFKHGSLIDGFLRIKVSINIRDNQLKISIQNTFLEDKDQLENSGIGIENIKKRLELNYQNRYILKNNIENNQYQVFLVLKDLYKN